MPFARSKRIKLSELPDFIGSELPEAIQAFKHELMDMFDNRAPQYAKDYARRVMPSGGGSYLNTITWKDETPERRVIREDEIGILYSDHEWAEAIEKGTKGHRITSGAEFNIGKEEFEHKLYHGTQFRKEVMKEGLRPRSKDEYEKMIGNAFKKFGLDLEEEEKKSYVLQNVMDEVRRSPVVTKTVWGADDPRVARTYAKAGPEKIGLALDLVVPEYSKVKRYLSGFGPPTVFEVKTDKEKRGINRPIAVDAATIPPEHLRIHKPKKLKLSPTLAKRGKKGSIGKIPPAGRVPRGTKYGPESYYADNVIHPGARPFRIFENTGRWIGRNLNKWMHEALDRAGFR